MIYAAYYHRMAKVFIKEMVETILEEEGMQPGFGEWYTEIGPSISEEKTYGKLDSKTYWRVKLDKEFDEQNRRIASYFIPNLPEVDCMDESCEFNWVRTRIIKGVLCEEKIKRQHLFRLKWEKERCIIVDLDFVESAFRREVKSIEIEEYMVR